MYLSRTHAFCFDFIISNNVSKNVCLMNSMEENIEIFENIKRFNSKEWKHTFKTEGKKIIEWTHIQQQDYNYKVFDGFSVHLYTKFIHILRLFNSLWFDLFVIPMSRKCNGWNAVIVAHEHKVIYVYVIGKERFFLYLQIFSSSLFEWKYHAFNGISSICFEACNNFQYFLLLVLWLMLL